MHTLSGLIILLASLAGCVHTIHVNPLPSAPTGNRIPRAVQIIVGPLSIIGADHMPGITLLEWSHRDLSQALIQYVERRGTFNAVSTGPSDLAMTIVTRLSMASRERYRYRIQLQVEMRETTQPIKTYLTEHEAEGSLVRWVTASDRDPIEAALQRALDDVFTQIEADRSLYATNAGRTGK